MSSYLLQVTQTPNTSSCGAVALVNAVLALDLDVDPQLVADSVHTRLRRPDSSLPDYLLSRAQAGCTHRDLLAAADKYSLLELKESCEEVLCKDVNIETVLGMLVIADRHGAAKLKEVSVKFLAENSHTVRSGSPSCIPTKHTHV